MRPVALVSISDSLEEEEVAGERATRRGGADDMTMYMSTEPESTYRLQSAELHVREGAQSGRPMWKVGDGDEARGHW